MGEYPGVSLPRLRFGLVCPALGVLVILCVHWTACHGAAETNAAEISSDRASGLGRTLVVTRAQMKYGLDGDYLRRWVDRPLFQDSSLRVPDGAGVMQLPSYARMVDVARSYGLDGFAFLPESTGRMAIEIVGGRRLSGAKPQTRSDTTGRPARHDSPRWNESREGVANRA